MAAGRGLVLEGHHMRPSAELVDQDKEVLATHGSEVGMDLLERPGCGFMRL